MEKGPIKPLLEPRIVGSGRGVGKGKEKREGAIGPGGVHTRLGTSWGRDEVGGDGDDSP